MMHRDGFFRQRMKTVMRVVGRLAARQGAATRFALMVMAFAEKARVVAGRGGWTEFRPSA